MTNNTESLNLHLTWQDPGSGENMDRTFSLPVSIGRDVSNKVVLAETSVSRFHAQIDMEDGNVILRDLQSSNGTVLNGETIHDRANLSEGDDLKIGKTSFKVEFAQGRRAAKPSMDKLFGALIDGEAEPTITLKELDKRALFADLHTQPVQAMTESLKDTHELNPDVLNNQPIASAEDKLTGEELTSFLSKPLQKDMGKEISTDIDLVAGMFKPPKNMMREREREQQAADSFLTKFVASLKRLIGR